MEKVTVKPAVNQWINFLKMRPSEQNEFLRKLISQGRLSRDIKGGYLVFSGENGGKIYNPFLPDKKILYFIFKNDATDFIDAQKKDTNDIFLHCRYCNGRCNH